MSEGTFVKGVWVESESSNESSKSDDDSLLELRVRVTGIESYLSELHKYVMEIERPQPSKWGYISISILSTCALLGLVELIKFVL